MTSSPRLGLPFIAENQAQKHLTHNEALRLLDVLVQTRVRSRTVAQEPASAGEGDLFILPAGCSGERWSTLSPETLALFENGGFVSVAPVTGQIAFVEDEGELAVFDGSRWARVAAASPAMSIFTTDTGTTEGTRLTITADVEILTHDAVAPGTGDARKIINKRDAARTASVLFQSAFAGHAEIGLCGSNDLALRVSADGETFRDVWRVACDTGHLAIRADALPAVCALDVDGAVRVGRFERASLPDAQAGAGQIVFVPDAPDGATLAFSDGAVWRRTDGGLLEDAE